MLFVYYLIRELSLKVYSGFCDLFLTLYGFFDFILLLVGLGEVLPSPNYVNTPSVDHIMFVAMFE